MVTLQMCGLPVLCALMQPRTICNKSFFSQHFLSFDETAQLFKTFLLLGSSQYLTTTAQSWTFPQYFWQFPFFCPVVSQASAINRLYIVLSIQSFWAPLKVTFTGKCLPLARMELKHHKLLFTAVKGILLIMPCDSCLLGRKRTGSNWDSWKNYLLFILLIFQKDWQRCEKMMNTIFSGAQEKKQTLVMADEICQNSLRELFSDIWYIFKVLLVFIGWDQLACWGHVHW